RAISHYGAEGGSSTSRCGVCHRYDVNGASFSALGGGVTILTTNRHSSEASIAGRIASWSPMICGRWGAKALSHPMVMMAPAAMLATAAGAVARRQKKAASTTGVIAAA